MIQRKKLTIYVGRKRSMGDKVLRPAMVTITTGGPKREKPEEE